MLEDAADDEEFSKTSVRKAAKSIDKKQRETSGKTPQEEVNLSYIIISLNGLG